MTDEIERHVMRKYDIQQKLGKGVRVAVVCLCAPYQSRLIQFVYPSAARAGGRRQRVPTVVMEALAQAEVALSTCSIHPAVPVFRRTVWFGR